MNHIPFEGPRVPAPEPDGTSNPQASPVVPAGPSAIPPAEIEGGPHVAPPATGPFASPIASDPEAMQGIWAKHAEALADWALTHLVVRRDVYVVYGADGRPRTVNDLTREVLIGHFRGEQIVAVHTTSPENEVRGLTIDVDCHGEDTDGSVARRNWDFALAKALELRELGLEVLLTESNGRGGYHLRGWFDRLVEAEVAYWLGNRLVADHADHGLERPPEVFPKQPRLGKGRPYGNAVRLPGRHPRHRDFWTVVLNPEAAGLCYGEVAIGRLLGLRGGGSGRVLQLYREEGPSRTPRVAMPGGPAPAGRPEGRGEGARSGRDIPEPTHQDIVSLLDRLPDWRCEQYDAWLQVGMALHDWDEERGLSLWIDWSRRSARFEEEACEEKWATFRADAEGGITIGSLRHWAREQDGPAGSRAEELIEQAAEEHPGSGSGFRLIRSDELVRMDLRIEWLVEQILVAGRPAVLGGPMKALKTSVAVDLAVSVASGRPFLGRFAIPHRRGVIVCSAESGLSALRGIASRVAGAQDLSLASLGEDLLWSDQLPTSGEMIEDLSREIRERAIGLAILDPLYLLLPSGVQPSDIYAMGRALRSLCEPITQAGATLVLVHHFTSMSSRSYAPPELADLSFAGIKEYARQWLLLGRRSRFDPETCRHELHLAVGGSDGHSGAWHLDIDEGRLDSALGGRRWCVSLNAPSVARDEEDRRTQAEKDRKAAELIARDAAEAFERLGSYPDGLSKTRWRNLLGWADSRFGKAMGRLDAAGRIESVTVPTNSNGGTRSVQGWRCVRPGVPDVEASPDNHQEESCDQAST